MSDQPSHLFHSAFPLQHLTWFSQISRADTDVNAYKEGDDGGEKKKYL